MRDVENTREFRGRRALDPAHLGRAECATQKHADLQVASAWPDEEVTGLARKHDGRA